MLTIAEKLTGIVVQLQAAIGGFLARQARVAQVVWLGTQAHVPLRAPGQLPPLPDAAWSLLWHRLARLSARFNTLFHKWRHHRLPKPRARTGRPPAPQNPRPALPPLPRAHGWVNHRIPESAPPTGHLAAMLDDPETRAFLTAAPQAGRLLRPLCRALGITPPDWLRLPRSPRPARRPATAPPRKAPAPPERPLPPYIRAATRAWKQKIA